MEQYTSNNEQNSSSKHCFLLQSKLALLLAKYQKYYELGTPLVQDSVYDALYAQLQQYEQQNDHSNIGSPTRVIGYNALNRPVNVHLKPMLSLEHDFGSDKIADFYYKIERFLKQNPGSLVCQHKIDGVSVALRYRYGQFASASLRGNGKEGEDITAHILKLNLPLEFDFLNIDDFEIRGELYVPLHTPLGSFATHRHAVAGAVRLLETEEFAKRNVCFLAYGVVTKENLTINYTEAMDLIKKSFPIVPMYVCKSIKDAVDYFDQQAFLRKKHMNSDQSSKNKIDVKKFQISAYALKEQGDLVEDRQQDHLQQNPNQDNLQQGHLQQDSQQDHSQQGHLQQNPKQDHQHQAFDYLLDGCVFKVNQMKYWSMLGYNAKAPRYAFAIKFESKCKSAIVKDVHWSVGRTGVITPVLEIEPISIDNVQISRISMHNLSEFRKHNLGAFDCVVIKRSGDVIPVIVHCVHSNSVRFIAPIKCPSCQSELVSKDKQLICENSWNCKAQLIDRVKYMLDALEIEGLGEKKLNTLYEHGLLKKWADVFLLEKHILVMQNFDKWGEKSVKNIINNINSHKIISFTQFLTGLGIEEVGVSVARIISNHVNSWEEFIDFANELTKLEGIGEKVQENVLHFIKHNEIHVKELLKFISFTPKTATKSEVYVVLTGTFSVSKQALKYQASKYPWIIFADSVTQKTNIVICGEKAGSKLKKAKEMGLKILNETEWNEFLEQASI